MPHKLLLADDSVTIQRVIELTFADEDVQVIAVGNGADAIDRAQRDRPDIVLADVGMPERDGYEVAQFIKGTPALAHIPVVLLTGAFEPVDENRARAVGCDGVLVKPFEPQVVISRVKDLLAGKRPAGMWGGGPVAQGPVRQAPGAADAASRGTLPPPVSGESLEAYFDHLDAAFGGAEAPAPPVIPRPAGMPAPVASGFATPAAPGDPFADWDPDLQGDPTPPPSPLRGFGETSPLTPPVAVGETSPLTPPVAVGETSPAAPPAGVGETSPGTPLVAVGETSPTTSPVRGFVEPQVTPAPPPAVSAPAISAPAVSAPVPVPVPMPVPPLTAAPPPAPAPPAAPVAASAAQPVLQIPSLVDAFTALLAAEQKTGVTPSAATVPPAAAAASAEITDDVIETITARVLERLSDQSRPVILDVAERLVKEEIERIKTLG